MNVSDDDRAQDALHDQERPRKRFRHQSYKSALGDVHLPSATAATALDDELDDEAGTHLAAALARNQQLNLSPLFVKFHATVYAWTGSVALMLLHRDDIVHAWCGAVEGSARESEDNGLAVLLELLPPVLADLRTSLVPNFQALLETLAKQPNRPQLSPRALTATLSGLSALLRTLVPSAADSVTDAAAHERVVLAYTQLLTQLRPASVPPEIHTAVAELWGTVLRRTKGAMRESAVRVTIEPLQSDGSASIEDTVAAYAAVAACKSVNGSLHSSAPALLSLLIASFLDNSPNDRRFTLLRRVLTSLTHHCSEPITRFSSTGINKSKVPSGFAPIADMLADLLEEYAADRASTVLLIRIAGTALAVRKGSRWEKEQIAMLVTRCTRVPVNAAKQTLEDNRPVFLAFALAALQAGDLTSWNSIGRTVIDWVWEDPALALELSGALAQINWGGWKLIGLPALISRLPLLLSPTPQSDINPASPTILPLAMRILAALAQAASHMTPPTDSAHTSFWAPVNTWVGRVFDANSGASNDVPAVELTTILALAPVLPDLTTRSVNLVDALLDPANKLSQTQRDSNLGLLFTALAKATWTHREHDVIRWATSLLSEGATIDSSGIVASVGKAAAMIAFDNLVSTCDADTLRTLSSSVRIHIGSLLIATRSHLRRLRLSALRLLAGPLFSTAAHSELYGALIDNLLAAEECSLDVAGVRGRTVRITKVPALLTEDVLEIGLGWLVAQLKINLRPVWDPTVKALAEVAQRWPAQVWSSVWADLEKLLDGSGVRFADPMEDELVKDNDANKLPSLLQETERTWRDPTLHAVLVAIYRWTSDGAWEREEARKAGSTQERLDLVNFEAQLLKTLAEVPSLAEKHSRNIVPHFLVLVPAVEEEDTALLSKRKTSAGGKSARARLGSWLSLLAKFSNPKAAYRQAELREAYLVLLAHPDPTLQGAALSAIVTFRDATLVRLEPRFRALLDETRWRDEVTALAAQLPDTASDRLSLDPICEDALVRLAWGRMTERRAGTAKRAALLGMLGAAGPLAIKALCNLMCAFAGPAGQVGIGAVVERMQESDPTAMDVDSAPVVANLDRVPAVTASERQQQGYLIMLGDVLRVLGTDTVQCWDQLVWCTLLCMHWAQQRVDSGRNHDNPDVQRDEEPADDGDDAEDEAPGQASLTRATRSIRGTGFRRLVDFFRAPVPSVVFNFTPYLRLLFASLISPRLALLDSENTQAPSALLQLFGAWASGAGEVGDSSTSESVYYLVDFDERVLSKVFDLLAAPRVQPAVVSKVLDIADRVLELAGEDEGVARRIFTPHVGVLLRNLAILVAKASAAGTVNELAGRQISILSKTARHVETSEQATSLLELLDPLLRRPTRVVAERVKSDLLRVYVDLIPRSTGMQDLDSAVFSKTWDLFSGLFTTLRGRASRTAAAAAIQSLARSDARLVKVADLVADLNAFSTKRVEQYDFARRFDAFRVINEETWKDASPREWFPLLHNVLYLVQEPEELALRQNSAYTLRRFLERLASGDTALTQTFSRTIWPALKRGLRAPTELVRSEVLGVIAYGVEICDNIPILREMRPLLAGGDEEASFFSNICHVQVHRRTRAVRRLADHARSGTLSNAVLSQIFLPLLSQPIFNSGTTDHLLVNESISTTGIIASQLNWGSYNGLVLQYQRAIKQPKERVPVKPLVRTLVSILDNFHFPMEAAVERELPEEGDHGEEEEEDEVEAGAQSHQLKADGKIMDAVTAKLLPSLLHILEARDETEDELRIPVCVGIVRITLHLPVAQRLPQVSRLLTIVAQIFRSKSQGTRDLARDTLCRIIIMLGPESLPEAMKQLRGALLRGPHLHILAFVTHALLVHISSHADAGNAFADLDGSVADVVHVAAEVVFGESGKDVQAEGFTTKLKEVKGSASRGLDCFSLAAKGVSPAKLSTLLLPIRKITEETESAKVMSLVDEVLRRIASGLNANPRLSPAELLLICHTLISQNARFLKQTQTPAEKTANIHPDIEVKIKRSREQSKDHYGNNSHRFVALGLDVFVTAARRNKFDLRDADTIARLEPMVNVIGNAMYSRNAGVLVLSLKAAAAIVKCPLKNVDKALPVLLRQMLDVIKQTGSTESEITQTGVKTIAMVIRDKSAAQVKEKDLTYLLELVGPDLEEHDRQAAVFGLLRAIVSRKFIVPEIYDMMDRVARVMVTNQSPEVQELCRGVLLQFLLEYPQGKGRLQKQMSFLAKNLSYVYESGRKSAMELLRAILTKFDPALLDEYANLFFVALVMVMANDESTACREMAAELVKTLFKVLEEPKRAEVVRLLQTWASQDSNPQLVRVSVQLLGVVVETVKDDANSFIPLILEILRSIIVNQAQQLEQAQTDDPVFELEWQLPYQAVSTLSKLIRVSPAHLLASDIPWPAVISLLLFPHAWVRTATARLVGTLFASQAAAKPSAQLASDHPLSRESLTDIGRKSCLQLAGDTLDSQLGVQITKNLVYLGKCFYAATSAANPATDAESGSEGDDSKSEAEDDNEDAEALKSAPAATGQLNWLFSRLSHQGRAALVARRNRTSRAEHWTEHPSAVLKFFAAMTMHMDSATTSKFLLHILAPVQRVLEEDTLSDEPFEALKTLASEVQDLVQKKVGTTAFTEVYSKLRNRAMNVRRERKEARALMVATNPERAQRRKQQHDAVKKASKKRKNSDFREGRVGTIPYAKKQRRD